jgi:hypothetical protein
MIEIISAVPDPSDSYFFGDFPPWCAWVAALEFDAKIRPTKVRFFT